jgi:BirA family biotin operon repressor/biotin-[acetyl-CoA-carboxylase] ligase
MSTDILTPESITDNLNTNCIGRKVFYYPSVTSTMDVARQHVKQGAANGTIIIAEEQTAGRGRLKRTWISPGGNIFLSVILHPEVEHLNSLIMLASVAVARSIEMTTGLKTEIKWPNDILIRGRKTVGILIEANARADRVEYAVIGIGINVNLDYTDISDKLPEATSLYHEKGSRISRLALVRQLLIELDSIYQRLLSGASVYEEWRERLVTLGKKIQVKWGDPIQDGIIQEGIAEDVAPDGALLLRSFSGELVRVVAGDATLHV